MSYVISRARILPEAGTYALRPLASGDYGLHQLLWKLYPDNADFLFREVDPGHFYIVSSALPDATRPTARLFGVETKPYAPNLKAGDTLGFVLRACATVCRSGKRHDVVQDARHRGDTRPRMVIANDLGRTGITRKGATGGFKPIEVAVEGYEQRSSIQERTGHRVSFSTLEFSGVLEVADPELMFRTLTDGLGRAKAFGAGLMLVRRLQ